MPQRGSDHIETDIFERATAGGECRGKGRANIIAARPPQARKRRRSLIDGGLRATEEGEECVWG